MLRKAPVYRIGLENKSLLPGKDDTDSLRLLFLFLISTVKKTEHGHSS